MIFSSENWSQGAENGLSKTYGDFSPDQVKAAVARGSLALWRCWCRSDSENVNVPCGWLVTEDQGAVAFIWAYQGRQSNEMIHAQIEIARVRGFECIQFITRHKGLGRLFKEFLPVIVEEFNGTKTYQIKVR